MRYKKYGGLFWLTGEDPDNYRFFLPIWLRLKRDQRIERLLRKWEKTYYFKQRSVNDRFECEFLSLTPNDGEWHHIALSVSAWVKKDKVRKDSKATQYIDGVEVGNLKLAPVKAWDAKLGAKKTKKIKGTGISLVEAYTKSKESNHE